MGIVVQAFARADQLGPPLGVAQQKFAIGTPPHTSAFANARMIAGALSKVARWRLSGQTWPHPFFERSDGEPRYPITVLSRAERDALRPLCGPRPAAAGRA